MSNLADAPEARAERDRTRAEQAAANSARFPFAARVVSELRRYFPGVRVVYAREGDYEIGKRLE